MDIKQTTGINFLKGLTDASQIDNATEKAKVLSSRKVTDEKQLNKAVSGFEALLLHEMLKSLWQTVEVKGWLGEDSNEAKIYRDMLNQAISDSVSEGKGIGIKDIVRKELIKQQNPSKLGEGSPVVGLNMINQGLDGLIKQTTGDEGNENK